MAEDSEDISITIKTAKEKKVVNISINAGVKEVRKLFIL